jgi:hypothetical protein
MAPGHAKTAFVFAGGGSLGAIQVGMLRELVRAGERPDMLVGASVGALNASFFSARPDADGVADLEAIWRGLRRPDIFPVTTRGMLGWLGGSGSIFESTGLRRLIERSLPFSNIEDAAIPLHVVATNLGGAAIRSFDGRRHRRQHADPHRNAVGRQKDRRSAHGLCVFARRAAARRHRQGPARDHTACRPSDATRPQTAVWNTRRLRCP